MFFVDCKYEYEYILFIRTIHKYIQILEYWLHSATEWLEGDYSDTTVWFQCDTTRRLQGDHRVTPRWLQGWLQGDYSDNKGWLQGENSDKVGWLQGDYRVKIVTRQGDYRVTTGWIHGDNRVTVQWHSRVTTGWLQDDLLPALFSSDRLRHPGYTTYSHCNATTI